MDTMQQRLRRELELFFETDDSASLEKILLNNSDLNTEMNGEYPDLHRIADIKVGLKYYRVCRKASEGERLAFNPISEPNENTTGVPLWLTSERLFDWIHEENANHSTEPIDWNKYRGDLQK